MSSNIAHNGSDSMEVSREMVAEARDLLSNVDNVLQPQLQPAQDAVNDIKFTNELIETKLESLRA